MSTTRRLSLHRLRGKNHEPSRVLRDHRQGRTRRPAEPQRTREYKIGGAFLGLITAANWEWRMDLPGGFQLGTTAGRKDVRRHSWRHCYRQGWTSLRQHTKCNRSIGV